MNEFLWYFRAILYLFSVYNVISIGIVRFQEKKSLFWIHMSVAALLFLNFLAIMLVRVFRLDFLETIIFDYAITFVLIILNVLVWGRLYYNDKKDNVIRDSKDFLRKLNLDDVDNRETKIGNIANSHI